MAITNETMTIRQVADYLQLSSSTVYQLVQRGELPGRKVGGGWRFLRSEIDEWLVGKQRPVPLSVLVVDDEKPVCQLFLDTLAPRGHTVHLALSGEDAIALIKKQPVDLVFLDLLLPQMSGIDVYREICRIRRPPEVIVITSFMSSHLLTEALSQGLLTVIQKPFRIETVLEAVDKVAKAKAGALVSGSQ